MKKRLLQRKKCSRRVALIIELLEDRTVPSIAAFGDRGILAQGRLFLADGETRLTGNNISIGQFEPTRPSKPSFDTLLYHPDVNPTGVFLGDQLGTANGLEIRGFADPFHAIQVAGVIADTSADDDKKGVAPNAKLFSAAVKTETGPDGQLNFPINHFLQSAQKAARPDQQAANPADDPIKSIAVNASMGVPTSNQLTGLNYFAVAYDWMGGKRNDGPDGYNSLFVFSSGNDDIRNQFAANYNGLVVASTQLGDSNEYDLVDVRTSSFQTADGGRQLVDLVAPGRGIEFRRLKFRAGTQISMAAVSPRLK